MVRNFLLGRSLSSAYYREFFTSSGNWVCPPGVTKVSALIISSGLKGAPATAYSISGTGAGGRGGFYYYLKDYSVIPGQIYPVVVGTICNSTVNRNVSDFGGLVMANNMSVFASYNISGGANGGSGQTNNTGIGTIASNSLLIQPVIKKPTGEDIEINIELSLVNEICAGGAAGDYYYGQYGSSTQIISGGNGFICNILDLQFNSNGGYGCGGKGGRVYQRVLQSGDLTRKLEEGQNGGQGLVVLLYYK